MASRINRIPNIYISPITRAQKTWATPRIDLIRNKGMTQGEGRKLSLESRRVQQASDSPMIARTTTAFSKGIYRALNRPTIPLSVTHKVSK